MVQNYIKLSLETHLFFARIMKEHALFLKAGFPCIDNSWVSRADYFFHQFENLLSDAVKMSSGRIDCEILDSGELSTEFTIRAESQTEALSGIPINRSITQMEQNLRCRPRVENNEQTFQMVNEMNRRSLALLNGLIRFKENILRQVSQGGLFTFNYPLLIRHIIREAQLYRSTIQDIMNARQISSQTLWGSEEFWNKIMMEHALFIRGLLDPSEEELVKTAQNFAMDYDKLLEMAKGPDDMDSGNLTEKSLAETLKYREFKAAGTKGILNSDIASIIMPLLADHVLREANHYIRILRAMS